MIVNKEMPAGIDAWVAAFTAAEVPVLARTLREIGGLRQREDDVTAREISTAVLHDPLLTLRVLRTIESRRKPGQPAEITTIEHALMMMGATPFFKSCERLTTVESRLQGNKPAMTGYLRVLSRAHHAAVYAKNWAAFRHDIESDEVIVATLLRDLAEMLLWCVAPDAALEIQAVLSDQPGLRSADAQQRVLGIRLHDLQIALCLAWKLPALLRDLMDDKHAQAPRVKNVVLAVALARHSAHGWHDPALPDDYAAIAGFLKISKNYVCERVARLASSTAMQDDWCTDGGKAPRLPPLIPYDKPDPPRGIVNALQRGQEKLLGVLLEVMPACSGGATAAMAGATRALVDAAVQSVHDDLGLPRVMFAAAPADEGEKRMSAIAAAGNDSASMMQFTISTEPPNVFGRLAENGGSIWVSAANREALQILLTEPHTVQLGRGEFVCAAVRAAAEPVLGIFYADRGRDSAGIDVASTVALKCMARFLGECLVALHEAVELAVPQYRGDAAQQPLPAVIHHASAR